MPSIAIQNISLGIDSACVGYGDRVQCTDFSDLITAITKLPIASDLLPLLQTIQKFDAQVALKMDIFVTLLAFIGMLLARFIMTPFRFSIRFVLWVLSGFCALAPVVSLLIVFNAPIGALQGAGFVVQSGLAESLLIGALAASATMVVAAGLALLLP